MKRMTIVLIMLLSAVFLPACKDKREEDRIPDNVIFDKTEDGKGTYVSGIYWTPFSENDEIVIPAAVNGSPVTSLGGTGPLKLLCLDPEMTETADPRQEEYGHRIAFAETVLHLTIPASAETVSGPDPDSWYGHQEDGVLRFVRPVLYVDCDENNQVFYAKDGRLFSKEDDTPVPEFLPYYPGASAHETYEDLPLRHKIGGRYGYAYENGDRAVMEITSDFGWMLANIGFYRDEEQYGFSAAYLIPQEDINRTDIADTGMRIMEFSGDTESWEFTMAGEEWFNDADEYQVHAAPHELSLTCRNQKGDPFFAEEAGFPRDDTLPSQYPADPAEAEVMLEEGEKAVRIDPDDELFNTEKYYSEWRLKLYPDGVIAILMNDHLVPVFYRGVYTMTEDNDICYAVSRLGNGPERIYGRVHYDKDNNTIRRAEGYEGPLLIPYYSDEAEMIDMK